MKNFQFLPFFFIIVACSSGQQDISNEVDVKDSAFYDPYDDIVHNINPERGVKTIEFYLQELEFDMSLFDEYLLFARGFVRSGNLVKSDSVLSIMERRKSEFSEEQLYFFLGLKSNHLRGSGQYQMALEMRRDQWQLPLHERLGDMAEPEENYITWSLYSEMGDCDSAAFYLRQYIATLDSSPRLKEYLSIDDETKEGLNEILERPCPIEDTSFVKIPGMILKFL